MDKKIAAPGSSYCFFRINCILLLHEAQFLDGGDITLLFDKEIGAVGCPLRRNQGSDRIPGAFL